MAHSGRTDLAKIANEDPTYIHLLPAVIDLEITVNTSQASKGHPVVRFILDSLVINVQRSVSIIVCHVLSSMSFLKLYQMNRTHAVIICAPYIVQ